MDANTIKNLYPKSYKKAKTWAHSMLVNIENIMAANAEIDITDEFESEIPAITDEILNAVLIIHKRSLYDFFDSNNIYIDISVNYTDVKNVRFHYSVYMGTNKKGEAYNTRVLAEEAAFEKAFKILEENE